jgi:type IV pilus assembly protein PilC
MLEAGEASGKLDLSLSRMNDYFEREYNLKKKVIGAMIYPSVITSVAIVVILLLFAIVLPTFAQIFSDAGVQLPLITQILIAIGEFVKSYWFILPIFPIAFVVSYKLARKNPKGSAIIDKCWLKVPVLGDVILKLGISRMTQTFATLLDSGVPLLQSMDIVQRAVSNSVIAQAVRTASVSVSRGTGLAKPLEANGLFPPMVTQMIAVGEESGDLNRMLEEIANYYEKEVGYAVDSMTALIEPLIIVGLGIAIAFIVAAIMIPMFEMSSGATIKMD